MGVQQTAWRETDRLSELSTEFSGWRIGRGGSGHWWAVRGNELVRTLNIDELRLRLAELSEELGKGLGEELSGMQRAG
ncbi:hypothetical protein [Actinomadura parmotrematis]|uniref:Uncharacterized protein n=1 Tax=Actinomadura parmotrematis TaxID=2864039 RepID=A0ABS7FTA0_9ACTN|nr:hypothetical protein [Actinomadura parmotrematis]MBW8483635.1 hypothetical protein [Actinomadura parmotrematis]